jgi:CheY-like chemotaxis protein
VIAPAVFPGAFHPPPFTGSLLRSSPALTAGRAVADRTVLVVEDEDILRVIVADALVEEGFTVLQATHGRAALDLIHRLGPTAIHLILLDMRMPVMDGWAFAAAYRRIAGATAPLVVMTAAQDAEAWGDQVGAAATVSKPFDLSDLIDTVERFIPRT